MSQRKSPSFRHTLKQSPFRSSFGPSRSFGGTVAGLKNNNKKKSNRR